MKTAITVLVASLLWALVVHIGVFLLMRREYGARYRWHQRAHKRATKLVQRYRRNNK